MTTIRVHVVNIITAAVLLASLVYIWITCPWYVCLPLTWASLIAWCYNATWEMRRARCKRCAACGAPAVGEFTWNHRTCGLCAEHWRERVAMLPDDLEEALR